MSARLGTFARVSVSGVSRLAAISGNAAFLAPPIGIMPSSGTPPLIRILSIISVPHAAYRRGPFPPWRLLLLERGARLKPAVLAPDPTAWAARLPAAAVPAVVPCAGADFRATP